METQTATTNGVGEIPTKNEVTVTVKRGALTPAIKLALGHASKDGTRPNMAGVLFETVKQGLRLVSTDGHRLALCDIVTELDGEAPKIGSKVFISYSSARNVLNAVKGKASEREMPCMVTFGADSLDVRPVGGSGVKVQGVDENFPPYDKVIPAKDKSASWGGLIGASSAYLADAFRLLKPFTPERTGGVQIRVSGDRDPIRIDAEGSDLGCSATVVVMPMRV